MRYPEYLEILFTHFRKLPGVGGRSSERFGFSLLSWSKEEILAFADVIKNIPEKITHCSQCGAISEEKCTFCEDPKRDSTYLCLVASPKDIFSVEQTGQFRGQYYVLESLLNPLEEKMITNEMLDRLKKRIESLNVEEVVIALDSTLEGDATSHYLKEALAPLNIKTSRLAFGLPMGSALESCDPGTLARAFSHRSLF